jgi:hypothetical protein
VKTEESFLLYPAVAALFTLLSTEVKIVKIVKKQKIGSKKQKVE